MEACDEEQCTFWINVLKGPLCPVLLLTFVCGSMALMPEVWVDI